LQLEALLHGQRIWVSNLANASSLMYNSLLAFSSHFGKEDKAVNWCGFYIHEKFFPGGSSNIENTKLLLGPFGGKPACQYINITPGKARGVCAEAYLKRETVIVDDVNNHPGHIACDGDTQSEIVCPLVLRQNGSEAVVGVLDLDCLSLGGFDEDDKVGLEKIARLIAQGCDW